MQQSQEGIKKDIIKHPFRNIEVVYEANKTTLSPQDEELLASYIRLHDVELQMKNTANELYRESIPVEESIESLHKDLKKVQETFDACLALADKLSDTTYATEETSLEKLAQARDQTEELLRDYNDKILAVYAAAKVIQDKLNENNKNDEEAIDALYGEVSSLAMDHLANWENNAIDGVDFDQQFDKFREYRAAIEDQRETLISSCQEVMTKYTNLNLQTSTLYNVWNEFVKRFDLLTSMSDLRNKATGFTEN